MLVFLKAPTAQKMKFPIKDFFSKCDQIRSFLRIWSHFLKKSLMENFIFCAVSILGTTLFLLQINDLPDNVICNVAIYANDTNFCSKFHQASDLWQKLKLASELESDLRKTLDWGRKWFVDFNAGETHLTSFDRSNNSDAIAVKMNGFVLEEKLLFKLLGLSF